MLKSLFPLMLKVGGDMKVLGITDEVTSCSCCGRTGLKCTVAIDAGGEVVYYGRTCATRHTGKAAKDITKEAFAAQKERERAARLEYEASAEEKAFNDAVKAENARKAFGKERMERLRPFAEAAFAKRLEIDAKHKI